MEMRSEPEKLLFLSFRKRITADMMKEITDEAFAAEAKKAIENEDNDNGGNGADDGVGYEKPNKGAMLLDATLKEHKRTVSLCSLCSPNAKREVLFRHLALAFRKYLFYETVR